MRGEEQLDYARIACRICLLAAAISALPVVCSYAADLNQTLKSPTPFVVAPAAPPKGAKAGPQASPVAPTATGAEIVGKLLSNPPSDPDVPLPQGNLAARPPADGPADHPTLFGRQEDGGGVFGLKIPIPADRGASERHTRSSAGIPTGD
jgi:hypothetical protein